MAASMTHHQVSPRVFQAMLKIDVEQLAECSDQELRPVLASLVRMSLIASLDKSPLCSRGRTAVLQILSRIELVNNIVALLSIDFHQLETDVKKEQQLRQKVGASSGDSVLIASLGNIGPALEFERSDATRRLRLVLSELLAIMGQIQSHSSGTDEASPSNPFAVKQSELFDHLVYLSEVCDVLAIAMAELPNVLSPPEVCEALLRLKHGPLIICHIVANQPDCFNDVINHLLRSGDKQDDEGSNKIRQVAILMLCQMNPSVILSVRNRCVEWCKMPSLAIMLTLEHHKRNGGDDLVAFVSGLLLGSDSQVRSWISFFVRNGQKKRNQALVLFRKMLLGHLKDLVATARTEMGQDIVVEASALLRLYTALKGIAGLKFSDDEISSLIDLITLEPPPTTAGVKFVSLGLCMLIACNTLISIPELEKRAINWITWLVKEESYFEKASDVNASFGEMLLLMAIHFHSHQLSSICDLVCQTLGMKILIRTNSLNRMKQIFTQEIFVEQVVAAHAVKVPVTNNLSSECTGSLPVHCIHQLMKSRVFSKHKVPIKDWIYRQLCRSSTPLHPILPPLIEVFVNSILVPASSRGAQDQTNEPISEEELRAVFRTPAFQLTPQKSNHQKSRETTPSLKFRGRSSSPNKMEVDIPSESTQPNIAAQILLLYYVLLYENVRLSHMRAIVMSNRRVLKYSPNLFAQLPIKYLLQTAERDQENFGGIFPQLLRLCSTHFPHLCLVQDWLDEEAASQDHVSLASKEIVSLNEVKEAFDCLKTCPTMLTLVIERLLAMSPHEVWPFAETCVNNIKNLLEDGTPRQIQVLFKKLWFQMNKVFPRKLWVMTVNKCAAGTLYRGMKMITQDDLVLDPLQVLRCDKRIFRCAPLLEVILYMLKATLAASRTHLAQHIQNNPIIERAANAQISNDMEREELKIALVASQESAAVQILLETGMARSEEKAELCESSLLTNLKEVQSLICSYLHEAFITDPNLAKLVHFQGYPLELLSVTVAGVPSLHICLDFAPELLSQPDIEKQVFAVDLISHLSIQYALPKSYSTARLAVNALSTLLSVTTARERNLLFPPILPSLVRFCKAFPPLIEDVVGLLLQYGKICVAESCVKGYPSPKNFDMSSELDDQLLKRLHPELGDDVKTVLAKLPSDEPLTARIQNTFAEILQTSVLEQRIF